MSIFCCTFAAESRSCLVISCRTYWDAEENHARPFSLSTQRKVLLFTIGKTIFFTNLP